MEHHTFPQFAQNGIGIPEFCFRFFLTQWRHDLIIPTVTVANDVCSFRKMEPHISSMCSKWKLEYLNSVFQSLGKPDLIVPSNKVANDVCSLRNMEHPHISSICSKWNWNT